MSEFPRLLSRSESSAVVRPLAYTVLAISSADLVGWWLHVPLLTSVIPHYATMKPNTALCLLLVAMAGLFRVSAGKDLSRRSRYGADLCAVLAMAISGVSLAEYVTGATFGIDQLLLSVPAERFGDPAGRMSLGTSLGLLVTSSAFFLLDRLPRFSTGLILAGSVLPISGLVGFVFQAGPLLGVPWLQSLAVHTAFCLLLLEIIALSLRPDREPFHSLTGHWHPEHRRGYLLAATTLVPMVLGLPILSGMRSGRYDAPFAMALLVVLLFAIQTFILWADSVSLSRVEAKLKASEQRSSRILHSIGDGVIVTDVAARVTRINAVAEMLTGWTLAEAEGEPLSEVFRIVNEQSRETVENPVEKVRRFGTVVGLANHTMLLRRDGSETHIDDSSAPIFDDEGELVGIVLVFRDVSQRKEAEYAVRTGNERLQIALETAQLGSWQLNLASGRMESSRICKANFGRLPDETFDYEDLLASIHGEDRPLVQTAVRHAIETGENYRAEYRVTWPDDSEHWIIASGRLVPGTSGEPDIMAGVTMDVTERHQAAKALLQNEKLAAVGRLASSIAHEINNPLESLTNLLYLARSSSDLAEIQAYLEIGERELRRVSAITSQTLRFHKQSTHPSWVSLAELVEGVLSIYQGKILNARVEVRLRLRATQPVLCLEGEIRQVVSNLIGNAIDIMHPAGGVITIRSRDGQDWKTGERGIVLSVADTGAGMSPRTLARIFEPFFTTKGVAGTGLGLWISHEIVARHRGCLRVRSSQKQGSSGTVFALFLPYGTQDSSGNAQTNGHHSTVEETSGTATDTWYAEGVLEASKAEA